MKWGECGHPLREGTCRVCTLLNRTSQQVRDAYEVTAYEEVGAVDRWMTMKEWRGHEDDANRWERWYFVGYLAMRGIFPVTKINTDFTHFLRLIDPEARVSEQFHGYEIRPCSAESQVLVELCEEEYRKRVKGHRSTADFLTDDTCAAIGHTWKDIPQDDGTVWYGVPAWNERRERKTNMGS